MKFSEAMLKGFEMVGGKQCRGKYSAWREDRAVAFCAIGAAIHGGMGQRTKASEQAFLNEWGISLVILNDAEGLPWEHIYGMAVAAGL